MLESMYAEALEREIRERGLPVEREVLTPCLYKGEPLSQRFRLDLLVDERVVVELKTVEVIHPVHRAQVLSYLRATSHRVGLLLNFHVDRMSDGIERFVL